MNAAYPPEAFERVIELPTRQNRSAAPVYRGPALSTPRNGWAGDLLSAELVEGISVERTDQAASGTRDGSPAETPSWSAAPDPQM